ncbi:MAG: EAL domain-containing protein [Gammaproteobacteria bacterium]|nr:EAL domain-containing protein [Gammaproteobacteria bacterium]MBU1647475.1 EAL domain-containing protein [Gammaproteobacteria bacterium]MBU1972924.1 EAL domain-containing protein [Gammaproteobacteria bacterium]
MVIQDTKQGESPDDGLRRRAERVSELSAPTVSPDQGDARRLLHELQVHQIELELQNAELRQARAEVEAGLHSYTELYDFAPVGYFSLDRKGVVLRTNLAGASMLAAPRSQVTGRRFAAFITPCSRSTFDALHGDVFAGKGQVSGELTVNRADAPGLPVQFAASLDESGRECRAVLLDISERKRTEAELQLAAMVYQAIGESIMVTDADNRIIAVNSVFTQVTGYSEEEALGQTPKLLSSGRQDRGFYQRMWQKLESTGRWQGEIWNRRKNGEEYVEWLSINTVFDNRHGALRWVALFSDVTDQKRAEETIWQQANYDDLTGLPNRRLFLDRLQQEINQGQRDGLAFALLFVDLDRFKEVNDTLGHAVGDQLLILAAERIGACVRATDTVARLGGDEFSVIMADLADIDRVGQVAQNLVESLAQAFDVGDEKIHVSASVGITLYPADAVTIDDLLKHADQAMYAVKNAGRNGFRYFTAAMQTAALERLTLIKDLRAALAAGQFQVHFQPIVDLTSGRTVKAEALLRWYHPRRGWVGPADFIPVAEEVGLIGEIGDWVFREVAQWTRRWRNTTGDPIQVSVNMSPLQFVGGKVCDTWLAHLGEIGLPGECLVIEVTEGLLLADRPDITDQLARFHAAGIQIAIDDFGTGYSALSYLNKFDVDYLKIDRSFVRDLETDANDRALVEAIVVMAHKLGIKVVAEGVETAAQRDLLAAANCDLAQGYLYAKAMPAADMAFDPAA